jgi:hypothetical protein
MWADLSNAYRYLEYAIMSVLEMLNVRIFTLASVIITPPLVEQRIFVSFSQFLISKLDWKGRLAFLGHSSLLGKGSFVDEAKPLSC